MLTSGGQAAQLPWGTRLPRPRIRPVKVVPGCWNTDGARVLGDGREPGRWRADGLEVSGGAQEESAARKRFHSWGSSSPMRAWGCVCTRSSTSARYSLGLTSLASHVATSA